MGIKFFCILTKNNFRPTVYLHIVSVIVSGVRPPSTRWGASPTGDTGLCFESGYQPAFFYFYPHDLVDIFVIS